MFGAFAGNAWADPPGRVGRVSDFSGPVWFYSPDAGEWVEAQRNRPLTSGDRLSTDGGARADVRIGSTTVRLDSNTELEVTNIDDEHIALALHAGTVSARIRDNESVREFELTTPEGRFQTQRTGNYRFDRVDEESVLTVWNGQALFEGPGSALTVVSAQRAEFWLDQGNAAQYSITEPVRDDFSAWNRERNRADDRSASARYVSPEMTGAEDLDRYGRWEQVPDYGPVWYPTTVAVGWAPYSMGHWAWVSPWGWTWVDDAPWGFAPFHYGRWAMVRDRWCWVPGTYVRRPVYAPALVAWVGGPHVNLSISIGGGSGPAVGWLPLAPREVYVPTYRVSATYVRQVNITHVTNITNVTTIVNNPQTVVAQTDYQNRRFPHAVTVVPQSVLTNRQPVAPVAAQMRERPEVRQFFQQPTRAVAVAAPPVAAPPAAARRMQERERELARPGGGAAAPAPVAAIPPSPARIANPVREGRPERRAHDVRGDEQRAVPASPNSTNAAPTRANPPVVQAAPAQPAPGVTVPRQPGRQVQPPQAQQPSTQSPAPGVPPPSVLNNAAGRNVPPPPRQAAMPAQQHQPAVVPAPQRAPQDNPPAADERRGRPRDVQRPQQVPPPPRPPQGVAPAPQRPADVQAQQAAAQAAAAAAAKRQAEEKEKEKGHGRGERQQQER